MASSQHRLLIPETYSNNNKGPSINGKISMSIRTIHFRGGGVWENQHFFHTLTTFWPDFYYFHVDFWHSKNVVYSFFCGGRGVSESEWFVHS